MDQIDQKFIPLDKSWIIRMGILDMVNGYDDIRNFLSEQQDLGDDIIALQRAVDVWKTDEEVDVGESGTLYRLLKFASWKLGLNKRFIKKGTLIGRPINDDSSVINLSQSELLKLDNGTSQWASASALLGDKDRLLNPPFKLQLTYDSIHEWKNQRDKNLCWIPRYDKTIRNQVNAYLKLMKGEKVDFILEQAEDFCFGYVFGLISAKEGEEKWPALRGHESDRIAEIQETLEFAKVGKEILSRDHRIVQAIAMWGRVNNISVNVLYPKSVNKSWPQFWSFIDSR